MKDVSHADVFLGVKEVPINQLVPSKTYFFFSHTIKMQEHNRDLLKAILEKKITLVDYEKLTNKYGNRVLAFGHFAGMVGAYNALWTYGQRTGVFALPRMVEYKSYEEVKPFMKWIEIPPLKIVLTGSGRVGTGAWQVLRDFEIEEVTPSDFLKDTYDHPVFTQLHPQHYIKHRDKEVFDKNDFYNYPEDYVSVFYPYACAADVMINAIYWDPGAPKFFSKLDMLDPKFKLKVIADITCDLAPHSSLPTTIRPSTIKDPVYGFDPVTGKEGPPFRPETVDIMAIDNLPNELPRDASKVFGKQFITTIMSEILREDKSDMLERATITQDGHLGYYFTYLEEWLEA